MSVFHRVFIITKPHVLVLYIYCSIWLHFGVFYLYIYYYLRTEIKWLYAFIGSMDEGVTEGLQSIQGTPNTTGHMEEDERYADFCKIAVFFLFCFFNKVSFNDLSLLQFY